MKKLLLILPIFVTIACSQNPMQVAEQFNSLSVNDDSVAFNRELCDSLNLPEARVIVYFYNTGCSVCISDFSTFMHNIDDFAFDSLIVVASEAYDFILPEFFLNREGMTLPPNSRIVYDPKNSVMDKMMETYGFQDIFLLEQKRILMYYNTQGFYYDDKYGYCFKQEK